MAHATMARRGRGKPQFAAGRAAASSQAGHAAPWHRRPARPPGTCREGQPRADQSAVALIHDKLSSPHDWHREGQSSAFWLGGVLSHDQPPAAAWLQSALPWPPWGCCPTAPRGTPNRGFPSTTQPAEFFGGICGVFSPVNDKRRQGFTMSGAKRHLLSPGLTRPSRLEPVRCRYPLLSIHHQFLETPESQFAGIRISYPIM